MIDFRRLVLKNSKNISSSKIRFGRNFTKHLVKQGSHCISPRNPIDGISFNLCHFWGHIPFVKPFERELFRSPTSARVP